MRHLLLAISCASLLTLAAGPAPAPAAPAHDDVTLIRGARIFDGERLSPFNCVLIEGAVIARVDRDIDTPPGARVINAFGRFLMPGMIDCHTHTFDPGMLRQSLVFGVTTNLDMFTAIASLEQMRASAGHSQADIFSAGTLITAPRGHGTQFGVPIPTITSPQEADAFVQARLDEGSDYIKIVYDAGRATGNSIPTIDRATLEALIEAAHERDALAVVHITDYDAAVEAIEAGADGLVHTFIDELPDARFRDAMVQQQAFMIPTLTVIESVCGRNGGAELLKDEHLSPYIDRASERNLKQTFPIPADGPRRDYDIARQSVLLMYDNDMTLLAGTDAPNPGTTHGASMHRELELLVEAGIEPIDALYAATGAAADAFSLDDRGRIESGRKADLLLLDGDPTADIRNTRRIATVWKDGVEVDRNAVREAVVAAREAATQAADAGGDLNLISDFEAEAIASAFGAGWDVSTDAMMGGESTAEMKRTEAGADGSSGALRIEGTVSDASPYPWAGAMFSPGDQVFFPRAIGAGRALSFTTRGDGDTYRVLLFAESLGRIPAEQTFATTDDWQSVTFDISEFSGCDGSDVMAIIFSAGAGTGEFWFEIDDVRLTQAGDAVPDAQQDHDDDDENQPQEDDMSKWIEQGEMAPAFSLKADNGSTVSLSDFRGRPVVLYFYPKDDTPGCTKEACAFRDRKAELEERGAVVLGVSGDSIESHRAFREKYDLNFPLLVDADREVATAYGAWREITRYGKTAPGMQRSTFLIGPDGRVLKVWKSVKVDGHDDSVLEALDALTVRRP